MGRSRRDSQKRETDQNSALRAIEKHTREKERDGTRTSRCVKRTPRNLLRAQKKNINGREGSTRAATLTTTDIGHKGGRGEEKRKRKNC